MIVKRSSSFALHFSLAILFVGAWSSPAWCITDEEIFRDFRFNFANPGARALAMGGAFIAIANDATAAQANPARLGVLRLPEIFAEVRSRETQSSGTATGTFLINPSTHPFSQLTLSSSVEPETQTAPSVISFVWPFKTRRAFTVGFSRQELLGVESSAANSFVEVPLNSSPFQDPSDLEDFTNASAGSIDAELILWNLSGGLQITRDLFVGGSVVMGQLDMTSSMVSTFSDPDNVTGLGGLDPRFQTGAGGTLISTSIDDSDTDVKWSFGLFWKLNEYVQFGTVYKKGVEMVVEEQVQDFSGSGLPPVVENTFNVPDTAGFGVAYRPFALSPNAKAQNLLFAMDVVRVENEDLVEGFQSQLNVITLPKFIQDVEFKAQNQTVVHLGAEYYIPVGRGLFALRAGFFTDPDSNISVDKVKSDPTPEQQGTKAAIEKGNIFPERDDETHFTGGLGFSYGNFEFAAAVDFSDIEDQSLFSVNYRFRR
jgi:hypothetical protein